MSKLSRSACFYAPVPDKSIFLYNEFYNQDRRALTELGFEVTLENSLAGLARSYDLWFVWWWSRALPWALRARLAGRPCVVTGVFDLDMPLPPSGYAFRPAWQRALLRSALVTAKANVFVSRLEADGVARAFPVTRPACVPLGIDAERYVPGGAPRQPLLATIGWMEGDNPVRKGMPESIRILAGLRQRIPGVRLVIAGHKGSGYPALQSLAANLGCADSVEFPGRIDTPEKIALLQRASIYLQPSIFEGFGVAVAEAMSCGVPVLTTGAGALLELTGEAAFIRGREDIAGYVDDAQRLLESSQLWEERSRAGRRRVLDFFTYERRRDGLRTVLEELRAL
ncbi:MAG: glycosyltransferase family 4 protein [Candidatus Wallbacteria bacterium]|nr:glycosyltransferase family 4 protein [Candidatus Wallbacteria bacterium]